MRRLLLLLVVLCCFPAISAMAAEGELVTVDGVTYRKDGERAYIHAYPPDAGEIILHGTVAGLRVDSESLADYDSPVHAHTLVFAEGTTEKPWLHNLARWQSLKRIVIPSTMTSFYGTSMMPIPTLEAYLVHPNNPNMKAIDGVLYSKDGETMIAYPEAKGTHYDVPAGTQHIEGALYANTSLRSITLPEGLLRMEGGMLSAASALQRVEIPSTVLAIRQSAFPMGLSLREIIISPDNRWYEVKQGGVYSKRTGEIVAFPMGYSTAIDVASGGVGIASEVFAGNPYLTSISLPLGIREIEPGGFAACTALKSIQLPLTLERICPSAFRECVSLERIVLPPKVESIQARAFNGCWSLQEIHIPESVTFIDPTAFDYANPELVIYAPEGSQGHRFALQKGMWWAAPGGTPQKLAPQAAVYAVVDLPGEADTLPMYADASTIGPPVMHLPVGETVEIIDDEGGVALIRRGPDAGYVQSAALERMDAWHSMVALTIVQGVPQHGDNGWVVLYTFPSAEATVAEPYDTYEMKILGIAGTFYYVRTPEVIAYLPGDNAIIGREAMDDGRQYGAVASKSPGKRAGLYTLPDAGSERLAYLYNTAQVVLLGIEGDWVHVQAGDTKGYLLAEAVQEITVASPTYPD